MAISISSLHRKTGADKPPIIAIYGREKIGKTTLAADFPNPVFMQTEDGTGDLQLTSFTEGAITSFDEVRQAFEALATQDHDFQTLVVDSVTHLQPLIWEAACNRCKFISMERGADGKSNFGKGYIEADVEWGEFMASCIWLRDHKKMTIVLIGHETVEKVNDPMVDPYNRYSMRLHQRACDLIREKVDVLGYLGQVVTISKEKNGMREETRAKGSGQMVLNLAPRPSFQAGSRYENMPGQILINKGQGYAALAPYLPGQQAARDSKAA